MQAIHQHYLWHQYHGPVIRMARRRVASGRCKIIDESDIAVQVFASFFKRIEMGRMPQDAGRTEILNTLGAITRNKAVDALRWNQAARRGAAKTRSETVCGDNKGSKIGLDDLSGGDTTASQLLIASEDHEHLLASLEDPLHRRIVELRAQGFTNAEVADLCNVSLRSVERKLRLIRKALTK